MKVPLMALCVWLSVAAQTESFEKQAISAAQQVTASSLDWRLPNRSFVAWLNDVVGQQAGVVWQLAECGVGGTGQDAPACAEATVLLPSGDTVIVGISVGTFKKGLIGEPAFRVAVIKSGERLYQVRRLSDLPGMLPTPRGVPSTLPDLQFSRLRVETLPSPTYALLVSLSPGNDNSAPIFRAPDETPPPLPSPRLSPRISGGLKEAIVIKKAKPIYPLGARTMRVSGKVEVRVVISETGRVIEATAISGHVALHNAAVNAALRWVYKGATRDGVPVRTESVLTFTFNPGNQ